MHKHSIWLPVLVLLCLLHAGCAEAVGLPMDLTEIGAEAFMGDKSLEEIVIPARVVSIGARAFADSTVSSVYLPDTVRYVGEDAFPVSAMLYAETGSKTEESLQAAGYTVFDESVNLDEFTFYTNSDDPTTCRVMSYTGTKKSVVVPSCDKEGRAVESVYRLNDKVEEVYIPDGVKRIRARAFSQNTNLKHVYLPDSIEAIDYNAFQGCTELRSMVLPASLQIIGNDAFAECSNLKSVYLPHGLREIDSNAFRSCISLETIQIPESVYRIGGYCFSGCSSLTSVDFLGESCLQTLNAGAFYACTALKKVVLPPGITEIEGSLFQKCSSLESVMIPEGVTKIGERSFSNTGIREIQLPDTLLSIGVWAFGGNNQLETVQLYGSVCEMGYAAFSSCPQLRTVTTLPSESVCNEFGAIGDRAFSNCENLLSVSLPNHIKTIGSMAFAWCPNLRIVTIPYGVTEFADEYIFKDSNNLSELYVPETVTSIIKGGGVTGMILGAMVSKDKPFTVYGVRGSFIDQYVTKQNEYLVKYKKISVTFQDTNYQVPEDVDYGIVPMRPFVGLVGSSYAHNIAFTDGGQRDGFTLTSDNTNVAISRGKQIEIVGLGSAQITIHCGSLTSEYMAYGAVKLNSDEMTLNPEKEKIFELSFYTDPAYHLFTQQIEWSSSDTSVCQVDKDGTVRGIKEGEAQITVRIPYVIEDVPTESTLYLIGTCEVTVTNPIPFTVDADSWNLGLNESVSIRTSREKSGEFSYSSADRTIAGVTKSGRLTGRAEGTTIITITSKDGYEVQQPIYVHGGSFSYKMLMDGEYKAKKATVPKVQEGLAIAENLQTQMVSTVEDRLADYIALQPGIPKDAEDEFYAILFKQIEKMRTGAKDYTKAKTEQELIKLIYDDLNLTKAGKVNFSAMIRDPRSGEDASKVPLGSYTCYFTVEGGLWSSYITFGYIEGPDGTHYAFGAAQASAEGVNAELTAMKELAEAKIEDVKKAVKDDAIDLLVPSELRDWFEELATTKAFEELREQYPLQADYLDAMEDRLDELSSLVWSGKMLHFDLKGENAEGLVKQASNYSECLSRYLEAVDALVDVM